METTDIIEILNKINEKYGENAQLHIDIFGSGTVTCVMPLININKRCEVMMFRCLQDIEYTFAMD